MAVVFDAFGNTGGYTATRDQLANDTYADFNASLVAASSLTTTAAFSAYDVVVVGGDGNTNSLQNQSFATALSTWVNAGGGVVMTGFGAFGSTATSNFRSILDSVIPIQFSGASWGFSGGSNSNPFSLSGSFVPSSHSITNGVQSFSIGNGSAPTEWSTSTTLSAVVDSGATVLGTLQNRLVGAAASKGSGRSVWLGPAYTANSSGWGSLTNSLRSGNADRLLEQAVLWASNPQTDLLDIVDVTPDPRSSAVSSVDVVFSGGINVSTFTHSDISLTRNGGPNLIDAGVTVSHVSGGTYRISGLAPITGLAGSYVLTVNGTTINDTNGVAVVGTQADSWVNTGPVSVLTTNPSLTSIGVGTNSLSITFSGSLAFAPEGDAVFLGSSAYPAYSARQILNAQPGSPSGVYWFDSDGAGPQPSYQAYADMVTEGGGWILAINSVLGSEAQSNDITSNQGVPGLSSGHTRSVSYLATDQMADIRHEIDASNQSQGSLSGKYTGTYTAPLSQPSGWTSLTGNQSLLAANYGMSFQPTSFGSNWYGSSFSAIPSTPSNGLSGPSIQNNPALTINSYRIWVREVSAPPAADASIPGTPATGAVSSANYTLIQAGPNQVLGDSDDITVPLTVTYSGPNNRATLSFDPLAANTYRLVVSESITDTSGTPIDGDADGLPGGNWQQDFVVAPNFVVTQRDGATTVFESGNPGTQGVLGRTDTFNVSLDTQPSSSVVLNVTSGDTGEVTISPSTLTFTPANWDTPQTVTVTGVVDNLEDGNQSVDLTLAIDDLMSDDAFDAAADQIVSVTVLDTPNRPAVTEISDETTTTPTISFNSVSGATGYNMVVIDISASPAVEVFRESAIPGTATSYSIPGSAGLLENRTYRAFLFATNGANSYSPAGGLTAPQFAFTQFTVGVAPVAPPAKPIATSTSGAVSQPTIHWPASVSPSADFYSVYLINLGTGSVVQSGIGIVPNQFTPSSDLADGRYRIWVSATNVAGNSGFGAPFDFNVGAPIVVPTAPTGIAANANNPPTVTWTASPGATTYNVYLVNRTTNSVVASTRGLTQPNFTPPAALANGAYRIWVSATNVAGTSAFSAPNDFTVGAALSPPTVPTGFAVSGLNTARPTVTWNAVPTATSYAVYFINRDTGTVVESITNLTTASFTPSSNLLAGGNYRIWVRAINTLGSSVFSSPFDFKLDNELPVL